MGNEIPWQSHSLGKNAGRQPVMDPVEVLKNVRTVLVIDWPSKDVPEELALAGFTSMSREAPGQRTIPYMN
jgi:hypothetical protein